MINLNNVFDKIFPLNYAVIFFYAHPDDESFLSAGLLSKLVARGRKCIVVFGAAAIVDGQKQTIIRQKEAYNACNILGVTLVLFLKFCEPKYSKEGMLSLTKQKIEIVTKNFFEVLYKNDIQTPFILISYDRNGGYGDKDHKIIYTAGQYFHKKYRNLAPFLFETTINRDKMSKWLDVAKKRLISQSIPKLSYWSSEFGLACEEITHYYQLTEEQLMLKRKALAIHKSQNSQDEFPLSLSSDDFREVFGYEFLRV